MDVLNPVPLSQVTTLYPSHLHEAAIFRYKALIDAFKKRYGGISPTFIARSPGRVNLIGEHIDYAGFGVLPMAISRDVLIAVACGDSGDNFVEISNIIKDKYPDRKWVFEGKEKVVEIQNEEGIVEWGNYFKCGYKGILQYTQLDKPKALYCMIDGNVPIGSGLSSSAAFTCCSALVTSFSNGINLTRIKLAEIAAECERFIGLGTGNMDQTASICSLIDHALYIQFRPNLAATPIKFPATSPPIAFVIANSLVKADKVVTAPTNYNLRVVETQLAAYHLGQLLFGKECQILREVLDLYSKGHEVSISQLTKLSEYVDRAFDKKDGYTLLELATLLNLSVSDIQERYMKKYPVRAEKFHLYKRAKHVIDEAARVLKFYEVCISNLADSENLFERLGSLMNESHQSCRNLYNCSCKELDELVEISLKSGAKGSRLTGAGWGGCIVSLVPLPIVSGFIRQVREQYYLPRFPGLTEGELQDALFATTPGSGAAVITDI